MNAALFTDSIVFLAAFLITTGLIIELLHHWIKRNKIIKCLYFPTIMKIFRTSPPIIINLFSNLTLFIMRFGVIAFANDTSRPAVFSLSGIPAILDKLMT